MEVLAIDVEKVVLRNKSDLCNAIFVSVVNYNLQVVYETLIRKDPHEILDTCECLHGFTKSKIKLGLSSVIVKQQLLNLFKNNYIIGCALINDLCSLGINEYYSFNYIDLQNHFKCTRDLPIGLRSLVNHYYNYDIHKYKHDATLDAYFTMKLYKDIYSEHLRFNIYPPFDNIIRLPKLSYFEIKKQYLNQKKNIYFTTKNTNKEQENIQA